jgi:hypothetical protein
MSDNSGTNNKQLDFGDPEDVEKNLLKKKETYYKEFQMTDNGKYIKIYTIDSDGKKQYLSLKGKKVSSDMKSITIGKTRHTLVFAQKKKEFDCCMCIGPVCDCMFPYFCMGMCVLIITLIVLAMLNKI